MDGFVIIFCGFLIACAIERLFPHLKLVRKDGWLLRAAVFNIAQLSISMLGFYTWEKWTIDYTNGKSVFNLQSFFDKNYPNSNYVAAGFLAYFINTWLFYWWHRIRHESEILWLFIHQLHHSPERIEVITSFYKHPFEIISNSLIITILLYPILGLGLESASWFAVFSGFGEFFYHLNVKTPYWLGYFIQRPESHCLHHVRDKRYCKNYSDLPLWDILGGTFENPKDMNFMIGFSDNREERIWDMLMCRDVIRRKSVKGMSHTQRVVRLTDSKNMWNKKQVNGPYSKKNLVSNFFVSLLVILGTLHTVGYVNGVVFNSNIVKGLAFSTAASPLPLVFSVFNGVETFSTTYDFEIHYNNGFIVNQTMDHKTYGLLEGPYNRKNVYGAVFSHGPFFDQPNIIKVREQILYWSICNPGTIAKEFNMTDYGPIKNVTIVIKSKTIGNEHRVWKMNVAC